MGGRQTADTRSRLLARLRSARERGDAAEEAQAVADALAALPDDPFIRCAAAGWLVRTGRAAEGLCLADGLLAERPGETAALLVRGEALLRLRRPGEAVAAAEAAWERRPSPAAARLLVRSLRRFDRGGARALAFCRQAVLRLPGDGGLQLLLGELARQAGDVAAAEEAFRLAEEADRRDGAEVGLASSRRLELQLEGLTPESALAELARVLHVPSRARSPHLQALRGRLLARAGRYEDSVEAFRLAARLAPADAGFRASLIYALRRAGLAGEALPLLQVHLEADPGDVAALSTFVADSRRLGRSFEARGFLRHLLRLHPDRGYLWSWLRRLGAGDGAGRG